jgi:hypothetical protein
MEAVKTAFLQAVKARYSGTVILELESTDLYFKLWMDCCSDYVFYFRPDDTHRKCTSYYAYLPDMESCADVSAEREGWNQQQIFQLVRREHQIPRGELVDAMCRYLKDATARIKLLKGVEGRGFFKKVMTFQEAALQHRLNPKPKRPPPIIPPPVHKRHNEVHWEADKRRMKRDGTFPKKKEEEEKPKKKKESKKKEPAAAKKKK